MKERIFYVINLDKQRIGVLSLFLFALFFSFFFLGVSVGKGRLESASIAQNSASHMPETPKIAINENTTEEGIPAPLTQELGIKNSKSKEPVALNPNMDVPMSDIGNTANTNYAESSTRKDEEDEKKSQVIDLTKPVLPTKKSEIKRREVAFKNRPATKSKLTTKKEILINENLYTIQLGAFGTRDVAESLVGKVNQGKQKSKAFIVYKNGFFVVQMGKNSDKESLRKQIGKLSSEIRGKAMVVSFIPLNR